MCYINKTISFHLKKKKILIANYMKLNTKLSIPNFHF